MRGFLLIFLFVVAGCSPRSPIDDIRLMFALPNSFFTEEGKDSLQREWWKDFQDPDLQRYIEIALHENFSIKAAINRLKQAEELTVIAGAPLYPQVDLSARGGRQQFQSDLAGGSGALNRADNLYALSAGLGFELDLWKRLSSRRKAAEYRFEQASTSLEGMKIDIALSVSEAWIRLLEQEMLLRLLNDQEETARTFLELVELRFSLGRGTALDVLRQRRELQSVLVQYPAVLSLREQSFTGLSVLLGRAPGTLKGAMPLYQLPELPELPVLFTPADLILFRSDLQQSLLEIRATDAEVAAAIADRLPQIRLSLSYTLQSGQWSRLFTDEINSIIGSLIAPVIDGGRRRAEVRRLDARLEELFNTFQSQYLSALKEVEDALTRERYQQELVQILADQVQISQMNLNESQSRYVNGLDDYLSVVVALRTLQEAERGFLRSKHDLLLARLNLYEALGGGYGMPLRSTYGGKTPPPDFIKGKE